MSNLLNLINRLSKASPLATPLKMMHQRIQAKENANGIYDGIMPLLSDALMRGLSYDSAEIQGIVGVLRELPADGARKRNFEHRYLRSESGLRELPRYASSLNGAYWH